MTNLARAFKTIKIAILKLRTKKSSDPTPESASSNSSSSSDYTAELCRPITSSSLDIWEYLNRMRRSVEEGIEEKMRGGGRRRERWDTTGFGGKRGGGRRREKWGVLEALLRTTLKVIYN